MVDVDERGTGRGRCGIAALIAGVLVAMATLLMAGCGDGADEPQAQPTAVAPETAVPEVTVPAEVVDLSGQARVEISVTDNQFTPAALRVSPGTEVVFTNEGLNHHNVTPAEEGAFEAIPTEALDEGASASITFDGDGTYGFYCTLHGTASRGQNGVVVVGPD